MTTFWRILPGIPPVFLFVLSTAGLAQERTLATTQPTRPGSLRRQPDAGKSQVPMARDAYAPRPILTAITTPSLVLPVEDSARQDDIPVSAPCQDDCHGHRGLFGKIKGWWHHRRHHRASNHCNGCTTCETHAQAPEQLPLGYILNEHVSTQISNGEAARMVLYHYDFIDGTARLNVRGKRRLAEIAERIPRNFHPVIIQQTVVRPSGNPQRDEKLESAADELDQKRKQTVVAALREMTIPVPEQRVRVGIPPSTGLRADEEQAKRVYESLLVPDGGVGASPAGTPTAGSASTP